MRITTDMFAQLASSRAGTRSSGSIREAGSMAVQSAAFYLSNAIAYVTRRRRVRV